MLIDNVVENYLAGKPVNLRLLNDSFSRIGEATKYINHKDPDYLEHRKLEKLVFARRNELLEKYAPQDACLDYNDKIRALLKTDDGCIFLHHVIVPLYLPYLKSAARRFYPESALSDDIASVLVNGKHMSDVDVTADEISFGGGLYHFTVNFNGLSSFQTYLHRTCFAANCDIFRQLRSLRKHESLLTDYLPIGKNTHDFFETVAEQKDSSFTAITEDETTYLENFWQEYLAPRLQQSPKRLKALELLSQGVKPEDAAKQLGMGHGTLRSGIHYVRTYAEEILAAGICEVDAQIARVGLATAISEGKIAPKNESKEETAHRQRLQQRQQQCYKQKAEEVIAR